MLRVLIGTRAAAPLAGACQLAKIETRNRRISVTTRRPSVEMLRNEWMIALIKGWPITALAIFSHGADVRPSRLDRVPHLFSYAISICARALAIAAAGTPAASASAAAAFATSTSMPSGGARRTAAARALAAASSLAAAKLLALAFPAPPAA